MYVWQCEKYSSQQENQNGCKCYNSAENRHFLSDIIWRVTRSGKIVKYRRKLYIVQRYIFLAIHSWPAQSKSKTSVGQSEQPDPVPAMWSLPFNANPEQTVNANYWCRNWAKVAERVTILPEDSVLDCPCTVGQALGDNGHFEILPTCSGEGDIVDDCKYRQDARVCVRAKFGRWEFTL